MVSSIGMCQFVCFPLIQFDRCNHWQLLDLETQVIQRSCPGLNFPRVKKFLNPVGQVEKLKVARSSSSVVVGSKKLIRSGFKTLCSHSSVDSSNSMNALHSSRCCFCKSAWIASKASSYNFVSSVHSSQTFCSDLVRQKRLILLAHRLAERKRKGVHVIGFVEKLLLRKPQLTGL